MPVTPVADLAAYLKQDVDTATAEQALNIAEALVQLETGPLTVDPWPYLLKGVALSAAGRIYSNPEGFAQETIGSYSYRRVELSILGGTDPGTAFLTDMERRVCWLYAGRGVASAALVLPSEL